MRRKTIGMMQSKTMWFSLAMMIFGAVEMYFPYLRDNIKPEYYGPIFMAIGIICAVLRFYTTLPLDEK
jgi:hypothetical protein